LIASAFELKFPSHRLVNRACARRLLVFHSPTINSQSVVPFQLHGSGLVVINTASVEKEFKIGSELKPQLSPARSRQRIEANSAEIWIHD
jgi:hypothetical protein